MAFPLTEEQQKIIDDRGGELLVSAAAGSGKTRVLVERLLDRVTGEGEDIDRFLVITYTKAAAAELRARVAQELSLRLAERPNDRRLRRQSTLIYKAQISTIHSFCSALLRESGHLLDLNPDFRLCDEGEGQVLKLQVLEELLDKQYEQMDPEGDFAALVDTLSVGRDDSRLRDIVLDIFERTQSHPCPALWREEQRRMWMSLDEKAGAEDTVWGALLLDHATRQIRDCLEQLKKARSLAEEDELLQRNYGPSLDTAIRDVFALASAARRGWDAARACLPVIYERVGSKRKREIPADEEQIVRGRALTERVKAIRATCKKRLDGLNDLLDGDSREELDDLISMRPVVLELLDLVGRFETAYGEKKSQRGILDFSDLEHFAVRLLTDPDTQEPTALARHWSERFAEVMVDEYQDTNQVQNAIFQAISNGGRKLFQVGDVKQSIYRFRLADPTIFLEKYRRFADGEQAEEGKARRRVLSRNFRSRHQVLEGCNDLFRNVMSAEFGELDYTDDQALVPGAIFPENKDERVELNLLDLSCLKDQEGEREDKDLLEARCAARRIRELLDKPLMLREGDGLRPMTASDVMLLMRSPGPVLGCYIQALNEQGIPWSAEGGEDFFQTTEVNVALSLLQIVDNPRQDVALIAVLRSPVYGFTGDELALLRAGRDGDFYSAVTRAAGEGDRKCARFLEELEELRFGMGDRSCRELVWHIYEKTNLLGLFGAMPGGGQRRDNLLTLYSLAGQMEESGCRSLFQFLLRLQRLRDARRKISVVSGGREGEGVSILSIHRSKGLEKPVVLVCGLMRQFNQENWTRPVMFHPEYGVGPKGLDKDRMLEYPTLARQAVALQLKREMMAEELRLLYVAMTRAEEKLILTLGLTQGWKTIEGMGEQLAVPTEPVALESQSSVGGWVLLHALTRPESEFLRQQAGLPPVVADELGPAWDIRWLDGAPLLLPPVQKRTTEENVKEPQQPLSALLSWSYPHTEAVDMPSKLTATQLRRDGIAFALETETDAEKPESSFQTEHFVRPLFVSQERGLTPAQKGTALHMAMQFIPVQADHSEAALREELARLVAQGFLTVQQGEAVQPEKLAAFYRSPLGRAVEKAPVYRQEFKFSVLVPAERYGDGLEGEQVLLQGVIDCWFEDEDGVTVLDFKSDRLHPGEETRRAEEYRPQLESYAQALEAMLGKAVKRKVLWFFDTDTAVVL